ncbi:MAG: adenylate/guanylate cyclase domain-containing protein [Chloroflexota bacterium]
MTHPTADESRITDTWRNFLTAGKSREELRVRHLLHVLPGTPRCPICHAPLHGPGAPIARVVFGKRPSNLNPKLCNVCDNFARDHQGGAEIELSLLFADVRGSTTLAERLGTLEFSRLINRFYTTASDVMIHSDALIDKIIGDQAAGMYVPGIAGRQHARRAIEAAQAIMRATGHGSSGSPWIPLGAGVHTGQAFVGAVGSKTGTFDITVLGDTPNTAARLASSAADGEILISTAAYQAAGVDFGPLETRHLELKGKSQPITVHVLTRSTTP